MKNLKSCVVLSSLIILVQISFGKNLYALEKWPKYSAVPSPGIKHAVPGTPHYRTVGNKGMAIQCLYPFNRHCLLFLKHEISDQGQCFSQFAIEVPFSYEMIEPNTFHLGLYDDSGTLVYRDITNSIRQYSCDQGFFEIIFPEGF